MSGDRWFALLLLLLNLLAAVVFFVVVTVVRRGERTKNWIQALVILLCPVIGPLYLLASSLVYRCFYRNKLDRAIVSFSKDRMASYRMPEEEAELNLVPISEALAVSHKSDQRRLLMQVLKTDAGNTLEPVRRALESEDSETSHYAATAILDVTAKFEADAERQLKLLRQDPRNLVLTMRCAELLYSFLRQNVLSGLEQRSYVYEAENVYESLYQYHRDEMEPIRYYEITELLLKTGDLPEADKWSQRAMDGHEETLDAYRARLQVLYRAGDRQAFLDCLERLKRSDIRIDGQTLEMIRFLG